MPESGTGTPTVGNSVNNSIADWIETTSHDELGTLQSIDLTLKAIAKSDGLMISQSSLRDLADIERQNDNKQQGRQRASQRAGQQQYGPNNRFSRDNSYGDGFDRTRARRKAGSTWEKLTDDFEDAFREALFGQRKSLRDMVDESYRNFAESLGMTTDELGKELGKKLGERAKDFDLNIGNFTFNMGKMADQWARESDFMKEGVNKVVQTGLSGLADVAFNGGSVSAALGSVASTATELLNPEMLVLHAAVLAGALAFDVLTDAIALYAKKWKEAFDPMMEGFRTLGAATHKAANTDLERSSKMLEEQKKRIQADAELITKAAFNIIEESAKKVEDVWDAVLSTVTTAQGYTKANVQDLWSGYARRLQQEGYSSVVSSADIMESLESVLKQGLSGAVAEEFAYQATLLGSAVPTEDFFGYASAYASLAANAIKNGASQEQAIQAANEELRDFASNVLYAKREIAGGFTTSLNNASSLFEDAAKIAITSRSGDISDISGVLTSVSAIVGATAPDLANTIVSAVVDAATGGNASNLTALRSLAGTGASNTAFLQALAKDPKGTFETLFKNLANLQNMSSSNYMEVAEALSSVFGLSLDAFARVDFNYLADAISAMNLNNQSLEDNIALLVDGQTTSTDAQLRMQQINQYMIDEGLAYVLDSEVARSIQEHMWDEQIANQIMENSFAVDIVGGALSLFEGISRTLTMISNLVNPLSWVKKASNLAFQALEATMVDDRVEAALKATVVGRGNTGSYYNLTTTGVDLGIANRNTYLDWVANGSLSYGASRLVENLARGANTVINALTSPSYLYRMGNAINGLSDVGVQGLTNLLGGTAQQAGRSYANGYYTHTIVGKRLSGLQSGDWRDALTYNPLYEDMEAGIETSPQLRTQQQSDKLSQDLQDSIAQYVASSAAASDSLIDLKKSVDGEDYRSFYTQSEIAQMVANQTLEGSANTFEDWLEGFQKTSGISNLSQELSLYGETLDTVRAIYEEQESAKAGASTKARELHEVQFWEDMQHFATIDFPWYMKEWERYYIQHEAYGAATQEAQNSAIELRDAQQNEFGDAVFKLAQELVQNSNWQQELAKELRDPAVQTNALLAQIVLIVDAIRQQNNESSIVSVPTALSALSLGATNLSTTR